MAVAISATGTKLVGGSSVTSINYTNITVNSGDTALIVTLVLGASATTSAWAATWDNGGTNQTMFKIVSASGSPSSGTATSVIFGLRNPTAGNKTLALSWTTAQFPVVCAQSYTGSDTTSDGAAFKNTNTTTTSSLAITSASGDRAFACIAAALNLTSLNQTALYTDTTTSGADSAASDAAGAATVTFTATGASGSIEFVGFDLAAAAAATNNFAWYQSRDNPVYGKPLKASDGPAFVAPFATPGSGGMAWFEPLDTPIYSKPSRDFIAPAFTEPKAVTVGISGMAWYEPYDQPIYGKKLRDFVPLAFTEPNAVTVGISGMSWFEPLDIPVYGKPLRDFVAPAFTEPVAVTVGIQGMAWFEPWDIPVYGKKLRDNTAPAFVPPFISSIQGNAWFEPFDIPVYGKPLRDSLAPSFVSQFVIAGISGNAWFVREDTYKRKPAPVDEAPARALQFTNQTAGISGMAWFEPPDFAKSRVVNYADPAAQDPQSIANVVPIRVAYNVSDTIFLPDAPLSPPSAFQQPIVQQAVGISGMAWFTPPDFAKTKIVNYTSQPSWDPQPVVQLIPVRVSYNVSDTIFLPDPPLSPPSSYGMHQIFPPVGISGMAWFTPPDFAKTKIVNYTYPPAQDPQALEEVIPVRVSYNVSDTIFLPDPPLSPPSAYQSFTPIIYWDFVMSDSVVIPDPTITKPPAWDPKVTFQQTVGISGMSWFEPPDFAKSRIVNYTYPPAWDPQFVFQIVVPNDRIVKFIGNVGHFMIR